MVNRVNLYQSARNFMTREIGISNGSSFWFGWICDLTFIYGLFVKNSKPFNVTFSVTLYKPSTLPKSIGIETQPSHSRKKRILDYFIHSNIMKDTNWKQCLGFKHYYQIEHQKSTRDSLCWNNHRNVYIVYFWVELDSLQKLTGRWVTKGWIWYILLPKLSILFFLGLARKTELESVPFRVIQHITIRLIWIS